MPNQTVALITISAITVALALRAVFSSLVSPSYGQRSTRMTGHSQRRTRRNARTTYGTTVSTHVVIRNQMGQSAYHAPSAALAAAVYMTVRGMAKRGCSSMDGGDAERQQRDPPPV